MSNLPVEMLEDYVKRMLEKEETVKGLFARVVENKIATWMKENITLDEKEITSEEFSKMTAEENQVMDDAEEEDDDDTEYVNYEEVVEEEDSNEEQVAQDKDNEEEIEDKSKD
jgi:trigger factor